MQRILNSLRTRRANPLRFVCISDTHDQASRMEIPAGDVLIHAGDLTMKGKPHEIEAFNSWLGTLPHRHKIVIAGNHDELFESDPRAARQLLTNCTYLQDDSVTIDGVKIYGSPWQPRYGDFAFNVNRGSELAAKWEKIPKDVNVLVTHTPPHGHGDVVVNITTGARKSLGCADLLRVVEQIKPAVHVFGHVHSGYGVTQNKDTVFVNASSCDHQHEPVHPPIVFDY